MNKQNINTNLLQFVPVIESCDFNNVKFIIFLIINSYASTCHFTVDKVGDVGLRIVDREPNKMVKYTADGETRFNFYLWVQIKEVAPYESRIKVTLKADLNPMIKIMVGKHLQKFVDSLAEGISKS